MPYSLVCSVVVCKLAQCTTSTHCIGIPDLNGFVHRCTQDHALVDMVPLTALNFSCMSLQDTNRLGVTDLKQFKCSITTSLQNLILVGLREACIKTRVGCLELLHNFHLWSCDTEDGHRACSCEAKVLRLSNNNLICLERTKPNTYRTQILMSVVFGHLLPHWFY